VEARHTEATKEGEGFVPREEETDYNHPEGGY
jgi:hypothetical protein